MKNANVWSAWMLWILTSCVVFLMVVCAWAYDTSRPLPSVLRAKLRACEAEERYAHTKHTAPERLQKMHARALAIHGDLQRAVPSQQTVHPS